MLELGEHEVSSFITLTYTREGRPLTPDGRRWTLNPKDLQDWLKRFRKRLGSQMRYWAVGEYGTDLEQHPHYHVLLFGVSRETAMQHDKAWTNQDGHGFVHYGYSDVNEKIAGYVTGYATKKWTKEHPALDGRHHEFIRMSKGLGLGAAQAMARAINGPTLSKVRQDDGDIPITSFRYGSKLYPLDSYLKDKVRGATETKVVKTNYDPFYKTRPEMDAGAARYHEKRLAKRLRTARHLEENARARATAAAYRSQTATAPATTHLDETTHNSTQ